MDGETLSDCNIQNKAILHLTVRPPGVLQFSVEINDGSTVYFEAKQSTSIEKIKRAIEDKRDIPLDLQLMIFAGKRLEDEQTLGDCNIQNKSVISLIIGLPGPQVFVKLTTDKTIILDVDPFHPIEQIKHKIQEKEGIPHDQQLLTFAGKELRDTCSLHQYNIPNRSTLVLHLRKDTLFDSLALGATTSGQVGD